MNWFTIYLITRLPVVATVSEILLICIAAGAVVMGVIPMIAYDVLSKDALNTLKVWARRGVVAFCVALFCMLAAPSQSDLAIIFAGHWATNSEEMQELPDNVAETINNFLEEHQGSED